MRHRLLIFNENRTSRHGEETAGSDNHNLAKVGVEGSNPFARSSFSQKTRH